MKKIEMNKGSINGIYVYRPDLSEERCEFKIFDSRGGEYIKGYSDFKYEYRLCGYWNPYREKVSYYEFVEDSTWYGQKCKRYYNVSSDPQMQNYFYVDEEGYPIGYAHASGLLTNYTFVPDPVPLNEFVIDSSVSFNDNRIHDAPETSICTDSTSSNPNSASSSMSAVFTFIFILASALFFVL